MWNRGKGTGSSRVTRNQWNAGPDSQGLPSTTRFQWNDETNVVKLLECLQAEFMKGNRPNGNLNKLGYVNIVEEFASSGDCVTQAQLKNKIALLKKDFSSWNQLKTSATGLGLTEQGTIDASDDWWHHKIQADNHAQTFRFFPLANEELMYQAFQTTTPTGEHVWSSGGHDVEYDTAPPGFENDEPSPSTYRSQSGSRGSGSNKRKSSDSAELMSAIEKFSTHERKYLKTTQNIDQDSNHIKLAYEILKETVSDSDELFYVGLRAFERATKRSIFQLLDNVPARIRWLQREQKLQERDNY